MKKSADIAIIEQLASEQRRVLSDWRACILLRRATFTLSAAERRWVQLPTQISAIHQLLRQMVRRGQLAPLAGASHCYAVTVPYATTGPLDEYEIFGELNPFAALSHHAALAFHGLTNDLPNTITALLPRERSAELWPPGTTIEDWEGLALPPARKPAAINARPVRWITVKRERFFGTQLYYRSGYPLRVTDRERTLLDALLDPEQVGGLQTALTAWSAARDLLALDTVIEYVERFASLLLQQRVGFILEELGLDHSALACWQSQAQQSGRGGSSKLLGSAPYDSTYSARWNLAINAPITPLLGNER